MTWLGFRWAAKEDFCVMVVDVGVALDYPPWPAQCASAMAPE